MQIIKSNDAIKQNLLNILNESLRFAHTELENLTKQLEIMNDIGKKSDMEKTL